MQLLTKKTQNIIRQQIIPKTKEVLLEIAEAALKIADIASVSSRERGALTYGGIEYVRVLRREREDRAFRNHAHALKRRKYIAMRMIGNKLHCALTEKGVTEVLKLRCKNASSCKKGKSILVTFDIPESERRTRSLFRRFLKECGFIKHQHSVWTCDREVFSSLLLFIQTTKVQPWVSVFRVTVNGE